MSKRKRNLDQSKIEKMIKDGRGQGVGESYKPWILIQDVPSLGRSTRLRGIKTNRQHELLSDLERDCFYILEFADEVVDIREQFPLLPLEETLLICNELGIKHPRNPKTNEPIVMTTDFLVTTNMHNEVLDRALTVKYKDDLMDERVIEKFEVERRYWSSRNIEWGIVTEEEVNKTFAKNISFIHSYFDLRDIDSLKNIHPEDLIDLKIAYLKRFNMNNITLRTVSNIFDKDMLLEEGTGIVILKHLIINKIIEIDLSQPISLDSNINEVKINDNSLFKQVNII